MEGSFRNIGAAAVRGDERTVTVHVPLSFRRKGGRKVVISPTGEEQRLTPVRYIDDALLRSLVQAFEWKRMLDEGEYVSFSELAGATKLNHSFVSRVLRLTLLAPDVVEAILDGELWCSDRHSFAAYLSWAEQLP
ncbi:hypothetical protein KEU06_28905 [Pseudaminobacter sp. 19-2017]|uniref:LacI family transcriptional regulator n=1 Tax=Pseudaminobacter soli (ex Zhang et al. 2022) TaxID=2831468 RepID=A0A942E764_9HYPH|nr:hypothetical protein [Pseudaminobacter soli]MBS3652600.1 hypothetical protein [Pseudaminobacter soli]